MNKKSTDELVAFSVKLSADGLATAGDTMSVRDGSGFIITDSDKLLSDITADDLRYCEGAELSGIAALHAAIYAARPDINSIIVNHAPYCDMIARNMDKLTACLDDMAQIIGPTAKVAKSIGVEDVVKTLKGRNACLIAGGGVVATGRTPDEAHTGSLVLEKGAKVFVEATVLGGAVKIPYAEALLMRFVYKKKYSKNDQKAKMEELK